MTALAAFSLPLTLRTRGGPRRRFNDNINKRTSNNNNNKFFAASSLPVPGSGDSSGHPTTSPRRGLEPPAAFRSSSPVSAPGTPEEPHTAYTHTSAHVLVPHTVSITVPRPAIKHLAFAPQRLAAPHHAYTELEEDSENLPVGTASGAVVVSVAPPPGLAHGLVRPGDVLICIADEWHQPTELFVEQTPFDEIARALREYGAHPVTLRFERYPQDDVDPGEFLGSHW